MPQLYRSNLVARHAYRVGSERRALGRADYHDQVGMAPRGVAAPVGAPLAREAPESDLPPRGDEKARASVQRWVRAYWRERAQAQLGNFSCFTQGPAASAISTAFANCVPFRTTATRAATAPAPGLDG